MNNSFNSTIMSKSCSQNLFIQQTFININSSRRWRCRWEQDHLFERHLRFYVSVWIKEKRTEYTSNPLGSICLGPESVVTGPCWPFWSLLCPSPKACCMASMSQLFATSVARGKPLLSCQPVHFAHGQSLKYLWKGVLSLYLPLASLYQGKESFQNSEP